MFLYIVVTQKNSELVKYRPHQEIEFARVSDKWYSNLALKTEANFLLSVLVVVIADVKYKCKKLLLLTYFIRLSFITMDVKYQKREKFRCLHLKETFYYESKLTKSCILLENLCNTQHKMNICCTEILYDIITKQKIFQYL